MARRPIVFVVGNIVVVDWACVGLCWVCSSWIQLHIYTQKHIVVIEVVFRRVRNMFTYTWKKRVMVFNVVKIWKVAQKRVSEGCAEEETYWEASLADCPTTTSMAAQPVQQSTRNQTHM